MRRIILLFALLGCAATLSPRQRGQPANKPMAKTGLADTSRVPVVAHSVLVGTTNFQSLKLLPASTAALIVNVIATNPPAPPRIGAAISWTTPATLLESTNLIDWTPTARTVMCSVAITNPTGTAFYRVPMGSGNLAVTLSWDASPSAEVTSYTVLYGTNSGVYFGSQSTSNLSLVVYGLDFGPTYYFVATAGDAAGDQSENSNEVFITVPQEDDMARIKLF